MSIEMRKRFPVGEVKMSLVSHRNIPFSNTFLDRKEIF